jgi:hypothetical protein
LAWGLLLYWIWHSYGCAVGKYPNTGDQACQWFFVLAERTGATRIITAIETEPLASLRDAAICGAATGPIIPRENRSRSIVFYLKQSSR